MVVIPAHDFCDASVSYISTAANINPKRNSTDFAEAFHV